MAGENASDLIGSHPPGDPSGAVPSVRDPSWMAPRYVLSRSAAKFDRVISVSAGAIVVIPGDGARWVLGFVAKVGNGTSVLLSPHPRPDLWPVATLAAGESAILPLAQFGPVVCYEWYAFSSGAAELLLLETGPH